MLKRQELLYNGRCYEVLPLDDAPVTKALAKETSATRFSFDLRRLRALRGMCRRTSCEAALASPATA